MIYSVSGALVSKKELFVVVDVRGVGYKVFLSSHSLSVMPTIGESVRFFTYLNVKEDVLQLFGFLVESELGLFEKLISVNGIGPRSALNLLSVAPLHQIVAAINEGKAELLTKATGIGKKTAERIALELKGKLGILNTHEEVERMESDIELEDMLISLGYTKMESRTAITQLEGTFTRLEDKLKAALKAMQR